MRGRDHPFQIPIAISREAETSLQKQIYDQIRKRIVDGSLAPGVRLTSIRDLAQQLGIAVNTVRLVYAQLVSEGYLEAVRTRGTFVADTLPDEAQKPIPAPIPGPGPDRHPDRFPPIFHAPGRVSGRAPLQKGVIDFWPGRIDPRSFPIREWRHLIGVHLGKADANMTDYGDASGLPALREAIAEHLAHARGFRPNPRRIVVTSGIQEALCIASKLLIAPGAAAVIEAPCYVGASYAFRGFGARLIHVAVDDEGLIADALPDGRVALAYVTPSHQFPLGRTLSMERRTALLRWASKSGAYLIEDDYDSAFWFENAPLPALSAMDDCGSVIYLGTFSKVMGAGIRLGYMVVPEELAEPATRVKSLFSVSHEWLTQAVMADYIAEGAYARRLRQLRHDSVIRRNCLIQALQQRFGAVTLRGLHGGMHIIWHLPDGAPAASELERRAAMRNVRVYSAQSAGADMTDCEALNESLLVFGYASLLPEEIRKGIHEFATCTDSAT